MEKSAAAERAGWTGGDLSIASDTAFSVRGSGREDISAERGAAEQGPRDGRSSERNYVKTSSRWENLLDSIAALFGTRYKPAGEKLLHRFVP